MNRPRSFARIARSLALASLATIAAGCNSYVLKGKVIHGEISIVAVVPDTDPRLQGEGLANAQIRLENDPEKLRREIVGEAVSGANGDFSIPFKKVAGNLLMYDVGLTGRKQGYRPATLNFRLPPAGRRILIILTPGPDTYQDPYADSLDNQVKRFDR